MSISDNEYLKYKSIYEGVMHDHHTGYFDIEEAKPILKKLFTAHYVNLAPGEKYWNLYVKDAIELAILCKNKPELINDRLILATHDMPAEFLYNIKCLLLPGDAIKHFNQYIISLRYIISTCLSIASRHQDRFDFGNEKLTDFINLINEYRKANNIYVSDDDTVVLAYIFGYLLFHHLTNYEYAIKYLANSEYFQDKLDFIGFKKYDLDRQNENLHVFNNMKNIFGETPHYIK